MSEQNMILVIQLISYYHILSYFDKHTISTTLNDALIKLNICHIALL